MELYSVSKVDEEVIPILKYLGSYHLHPVSIYRMAFVAILGQRIGERRLNVWCYPLPSTN